MSATLEFLGAVGTVTGSKFLLEVAGHRTLLDCGLYQGAKELRLRNWEQLPVAAASIDDVVLTHAHIDHAGYLPRLCLDGFHGAVHATHGTGDLLPIMLAIGLAVRLDSPGPIVHRRRVMGLHGRQFYAYKFRSMHPNGDAILADYPELQAEFLVNQKLVEDPRVTSVGRWLRKYSLDELPQLLNVLKGKMSLVGPRIISSEEMPRYDEWGTNLLTVLPGITGLWQVSGRSDLSFAERVQLDMHYVRNWTIWLDLQILLQTVPAVIKSKGAY